MSNQVNVRESVLPGVGIRYEMTTRNGRTLVVVVHRDGVADLCAFSAEDPDRAQDTLHLTLEESDAVADMLGSTRVTKHFADLSAEVPGLESARLTIERGSPFDGATLGDTRARTLTGCSVVAVVRGESVMTAPTPSQDLLAGDVLVAIGAESGLVELSDLLGSGPGQGSA
ncbi:cation:proton antiporter regulatory subunit [Kytococcus sedentarius]|uniref:cation:proton antiporter regulatory subunit n=1 Tax=Kytococcus sedentarius TaxID=1276 RepID=UPI00384A4D0B